MLRLSLIKLNCPVLGTNIRCILYYTFIVHINKIAYKWKNKQYKNYLPSDTVKPNSVGTEVAWLSKLSAVFTNGKTKLTT